MALPAAKWVTRKVLAPTTVTLTVGGHKLELGDTLLVKFSNLPKNNGIWRVTDVGGPGRQFAMERC